LEGWLASSTPCWSVARSRGGKPPKREGTAKRREAGRSAEQSRPAAQAASAWPGMGHWRAINRGITRSLTVTGGASDVQVRGVTGPDLSVSQADSASSLPVTRSHVKAQAGDGVSNVCYPRKCRLGRLRSRSVLRRQGWGRGRGSGANGRYGRPSTGSNGGCWRCSAAEPRAPWTIRSGPDATVAGIRRC